MNRVTRSSTSSHPRQSAPWRTLPQTSSPPVAAPAPLKTQAASMQPAQVRRLREASSGSR